MCDESCSEVAFLKSLIEVLNRQSLPKCSRLGNESAEHIEQPFEVFYGLCFDRFGTRNDERDFVHGCTQEVGGNRNLFEQAGAYMGNRAWTRSIDGGRR